MSLENSDVKKQFKVVWAGHDEINLEYCTTSKLITAFKVMGCQETINICKYLAQSFKNMSVLEWPIPDGSSHSEMMVRELLLKINGRWDYPYKEEELCHCRYVKTSAVDESILGGAHNSHQVTLLTGAASACSACQVHIEKIIQYRLKASA